MENIKKAVEACEGKYLTECTARLEKAFGCQNVESLGMIVGYRIKVKRDRDIIVCSINQVDAPDSTTKNGKIAVGYDS